jgi:hypothetical protein
MKIIKISMELVIDEHRKALLLKDLERGGRADFDVSAYAATT